MPVVSGGATREDRPIIANQRRGAEERIDALLLEGLDSGEPFPVTPEYWEAKKRRLAERLSRVIGPQA